MMVIQCGCLDMMRAEDDKLHSQFEWPYKFSSGRILGTHSSTRGSTAPFERWLIPYYCYCQ